MQAGLLRKRVLLQQRQQAQDGYGNRLLSWTDVATVYAEVQPLTGRKLELAQTLAAETTHLVTLRYRAGVNTSMRVVYQGRYFNIQHVLDVDMRHRTLELSCTEGLNDGQ